MDSWLLNHPGTPITIYQIAELVGVAHAKAMKPENIMSAFRKTGIYPFDRNIFSEDDFLISYVTDRPANDEPAEADVQPPDACPVQISSITNQSSSGNTQINCVDESSNFTTPCKPAADTPITSSQIWTVSPEDMRRYPKAGPRKTQDKRRKKGKSRVLTATPEKEETVI